MHLNRYVFLILRMSSHRTKMKIYSALWMMYRETFKLIVNKLCMEAQAANLFLRAPIDGGPYFRPTTLIVELIWSDNIFFFLLSGCTVD